MNTCLPGIIGSAVLCLLALGAGGCRNGTSGTTDIALSPWTDGYIDSPYMVPDGSAIYFLHSPIHLLDMQTNPAAARQEVESLPDHQGSGSALWWNTDLYVSRRNADGTWTFPENLGPNINTTNLECCIWVNNSQTVMIFTREDLDNFADSRNYMATRPDAASPWSIPVVLPGEVGNYGATGFHDLHLGASGKLYFWSELTAAPDGALFEAAAAGANNWVAPTAMASDLQDGANIDSQPWLSADERTIYYNRRDRVSGNTKLMKSTFSGTQWGMPQSVTLINFSDPNGALVWGEPSFDESNNMYFVRFDTSVSGWKAELMESKVLLGGAIATPSTLRFTSPP